MSLFEKKKPKWEEVLNIHQVGLFSTKPHYPDTWLSRLVETCPHCHKTVRFEGVMLGDLIQQYESDKTKQKFEFAHSLRRCPECLCGVYLISKNEWKNGTMIEEDRKVLKVYPEPKPQINKEGMPEMLASLFQECMSCYGSGYYRASAIMLRRCLEQICDEKGIKGGTLHKRLEGLKDKIDVPQKLFNILFDLKSLGNDAAHVELKSFDKIDDEEIGLAIEIFKKVIDDLYQQEILLENFKRLKKKKESD
jgi:hypothetical protein